MTQIHAPAVGTGAHLEIRVAALVHACTALLLAQRLTTCQSTTALVLLGVLAVVTLAGAWALWLRDTFERRMLVVVVAVATAVGAVLTLTVGLPGSVRDVDAVNGLLLGFPVVVIGCVVAVVIGESSASRGASE